MTCRLVGRYPATSSKTRDGHREYKKKYLVEHAASDGPVKIRATSGLPACGSIWRHDDNQSDEAGVGTGTGVLAEYDAYAYRTPEDTIQPVLPNEKNTASTIEFTWTTKPLGKCRPTCSFEDPLLEPPEVSYPSTKYTREATEDVNGDPIVNGAFEQIRGPQNEWPADRPGVRIQYNIATYDRQLFDGAMDCVNEDEIWGYAPGVVLLSGKNVEKKYFGACDIYYTVTLDFEIKMDGWHRYVVDEATKVLAGRWDLDPNSPTYRQYIVFADPDQPDGLLDPKDPKNYVRFKDWNGENARVLLKNGRPWDPEAVEQRFYWCVDSPGLRVCYYGTCTEVATYADGDPFYGPYTTIPAVGTGDPTSTDCSAVCSGTHPFLSDPVSPSDACLMDNTKPGQVFIDVLPAFDFLLLGVPADLDS